MGELYSVFEVASLPTEAKDFFEREYGMACLNPESGERPTWESLRGVLETLKGYNVSFSDNGGFGQADVQRQGASEMWTTLVWPESASFCGFDFYFSKGAIEVIVEVAGVISETAGALVLSPHGGDWIVLLRPGGRSKTFKSS